MDSFLKTGPARFQQLVQPPRSSKEKAMKDAKRKTKKTSQNSEVPASQVKRKPGQGRYWRRPDLAHLRVDLGSWSGNPEADLRRFISQYGRVGAKDRKRQVSEGTATRRHDVLRRCFRLLQDDNRGITTLAHLKPRHARKLIDLMTNAGISAQTQIQYWSILNWFWSLHGMGDLGPIGKQVSEDRRHLYKQRHIANLDRSLTGNGVTIEDVYERLCAVCPRTARLALLGFAFGMRRTETLRFRPHENSTDRLIMLRYGTKTGRPRDVDRELGTDKMKALGNQALTELKAMTPQGEHAGYPDLTLKQAKNRFKNVLRAAGVTRKQLGVTMHSMRHEYAIEVMRTLSQCEVPIRNGGTIDYRRFDEARRQVMQNLGHNRMKVSSAYYGSYGKSGPEAKERLKASLESIQPHLGRLHQMVQRAGASNLWFVGARSRGENPDNNVPYEFELVGACDAPAVMTAAQEISHYLQSQLAVEVRVSLRDVALDGSASSDAESHRQHDSLGVRVRGILLIRVSTSQAEARQPSGEAGQKERTDD